MVQIVLDRIAILLSSICAIHCVALPIVAGLVPLLGPALNHGQGMHEFWFHQFILLFVFPVSVFALFAGYRCHRNRTPVVLGVIGLGLLIMTALSAETLIQYHIIPHHGETVLTMTGGVIHAIGHIFNVLASRKTSNPCISEIHG